VDFVAIGVLSFAVAVKILLLVVCWRLRSYSNSVAALAQVRKAALLIVWRCIAFARDRRLIILSNCLWYLPRAGMLLLLQEYRNDVIMNGTTLVTVLISSRVPVMWWLDPVAAIGIAVSGCMCNIRL
jgi:divalent metal cation (Fe/Co/Zn/Cd) transporter